MRRIETADPAEGQRFLEDALAHGHEGVMVKSLDAPYEAGRRGLGWLKVKVAHTLDLVVLAAEWGHGRRQGRLSNLHLGARDPEGGFVMLGKTFKGMTDEMLAWQTEHLLTLKTEEKGHVVHVRPELVVEIAFDGVQTSSRYPGGLALRFARVKGYRPDKRVGRGGHDRDRPRDPRGWLTTLAREMIASPMAGNLDVVGLETLRADVRGDVVTPGGAGYNEARALWNGMIDRHPAGIVRAASAEDVAIALRFAREHGLVVTVRGGGHGVAGNALSDGGLVLDLRELKAIEVDPAARTARAGGGVTLGELDAATQEHGLATPLGVVTKTGIAGLTLAGGIGWLRRKHGLAADNLVSLEVVTADGHVRTASESENEELFWALRGGGGSFGVVTSFEYRLHPVGPDVLVAFVLYPGERATEVLRAVDEYTATAPEEVSPLAFLGRVPHADAFPSEAHGLPYVAVAAVHPGDPRKASASSRRSASSETRSSISAASCRGSRRRRSSTRTTRTAGATTGSPSTSTSSATRRSRGSRRTPPPRRRTTRRSTSGTTAAR